MYNTKQYIAARKRGYRSGLEGKIADQIKLFSGSFNYECMKIEWEDLSYRTYTPDFLLDNGIIIETKGLFVATDRKKHLGIKKQHPKLDIRFVFENAHRKLSKKSKTTYGIWCDKHGFIYSHKEIPEEWLKEKKKSARLMPVKFVKFTKKKIKR